MTDPIDPIRRPTGDRRERVRRQADAAPRVEEAAKLPAPLPEPQPALSAHILGQDGQKRGLRGGPEVLTKARAAYLNAEWSGPTDRRNRVGIISRTKV